MKRELREQLPLLLNTDRQGQLFLGDEKTTRETYAGIERASCSERWRAD